LELRVGLSGMLQASPHPGHVVNVAVSTSDRHDDRLTGLRCAVGFQSLVGQLS